MTKAQKEKATKAVIEKKEALVAKALAEEAEALALAKAEEAEALALAKAEEAEALALAKPALIKDNLESLTTEAKVLQTEATSLNVTYREYQRKTMKFLTKAVKTYVMLETAEDFSELHHSFSVITNHEGSVSESNVKTIWGIHTVLKLQDKEGQKVLLDKLLIIVNNENLRIGHLNDFVKSLTSIHSANGKLIHNEYSYYATYENIITEKVAKKESLLLPEVNIGGLYFTDAQLEEVAKDAKVKISYGRNLKKFGTIMVAQMKKFEGQTMEGETFATYLKDNIDTMLETFAEKGAKSAMSKKDLEAKVKQLEGMVAEKDAILAKKEAEEAEAEVA